MVARRPDLDRVAQTMPDDVSGSLDETKHDTAISYRNPQENFIHAVFLIGKTHYIRAVVVVFYRQSNRVRSKNLHMPRS